MTLLLLTLLAGCADDPAAASPAAAAVRDELRTAPVEAARWRPSVEITGSLAPLASVHLGFDVPGRLDAVLVERGGTVRKGEAVARLDASLAAAQLEQAEAALAGANAQLAAGEAAWKRLQALKDAGGVSEQQYGEGQAQILAARAGLDQARAAVGMARTHFDNHVLRAPFGGTVTNGPDNPGAMVGAGTPLFVLEDLSGLQLKGTAPETASWLAAGLPATVTPGNPGETRAFPARVVRVLPSLDPATRRIPVEVVVDAADPALRAHAYAKARVEAGEEIDVTAVPRAALVARPDFSVFALRDGAPVRVPVEVLDDGGERVLVRGAVAPGDEVVLNPPASLGE